MQAPLIQDSLSPDPSLYICEHVLIQLLRPPVENINHSGHNVLRGSHFDLNLSLFCLYEDHVSIRYTILRGCVRMDLCNWIRSKLP